MIIDRINISNFRSYYGSVLIDFKTSSDKNITLISGKNGFGKTSFLTALIWGFYGKLMSKVEDKYRAEIKNSGGYDNYLIQQFNRSQKSQNYLSVEIILSDVVIPTIPCKEITIKRTFNVESKKEVLEILIDGDHNELTVKVGYETFINDFILPREIAKFFFFDSEKIVSLAEAKTKDELRSLSSAYSEVLGLKKYEDLKSGLNTLVSSIRRRGVSENDSDKLNALISERNEIEKELDFVEETTLDHNNTIESLKVKSDNLQEKLIREGSTISLTEFKELKSDYQKLLEEAKEIRKRINQNLEYLPFLLADNIFAKLVDQVNLELQHKRSSIDLETKNGIIKIFKSTISTLDQTDQNTYVQQFSNEIEKLNKSKKIKVILDFPEEINRKLISIHSNVKSSYLEKHRSIVKEDKENRFKINKTLRQIQSYESKKSNPLSSKYREQKADIDSQIEKLFVKLGSLEQSKTELSNKYSNLNKRISEIESRQKIEGDDQKKLRLTIQVLEKINKITEKIKKEKKYSLEKSIQLGLNSLMHKNSFINRVEIELFDDYLDIHLLNQDGDKINKESLSKGEQQLYATSILKALVEESGIAFPIFVDSPLQKFDKEHSTNIIEKFYPKISKQVVLFPLVEKELTFDEFKLMESNISSLYKIISSDGRSKIENVEHVNEFFK